MQPFFSLHSYISLLRYIASTVLHSVNCLIIITFLVAWIQFSSFQEESVSILSCCSITRNLSQLFFNLRNFFLGSFLLCRTLATLAVALATSWSFMSITVFVSQKDVFEEGRLILNNNKNSFSFQPFYFCSLALLHESKPWGPYQSLNFCQGKGREGVGQGRRNVCADYFCDSSKL